MNDHEPGSLEREIESTLSVEPSADFVVRVRRRIAAGPAARPFPAPGVLVGVLAGAVVIATAALTFWPASGVKRHSELQGALVSVEQPLAVAPEPVNLPAPRPQLPARVVKRRPVPVVDVTAVPQNEIAEMDLNMSDAPELQPVLPEFIVLEPLPEMLVTPLARLEGITLKGLTIEPLSLVQDSGVHQ